MRFDLFKKSLETSLLPTVEPPPMDTEMTTMSSLASDRYRTSGTTGLVNSNSSAFRRGIPPSDATAATPVNLQRDTLSHKSTQPASGAIISNDGCHSAKENTSTCSNFAGTNTNGRKADDTESKHEGTEVLAKLREFGETMSGEIAEHYIERVKALERELNLITNDKGAEEKAQEVREASKRNYFNHQSVEVIHLHIKRWLHELYAMVNKSQVHPDSFTPEDLSDVQRLLEGVVRSYRQTEKLSLNQSHIREFLLNNLSLVPNESMVRKIKNARTKAGKGKKERGDRV